MNAGEAVITLHAVLTHLSRQFSTDPGLLAVIGQGQEACDVLYAQLSFPPPSPAELVPHLAVLDTLRSSAKAPYDLASVPAFDDSKQAAPRKASYGSYAEQVKRTESTKPAVPSTDIHHALTMLDSMIADFEEAPEAAEDYVSGIKPTVLDMRERIGKYQRATEKQLQYIRNMRAGLDKWFQADKGFRAKDDFRGSADDDAAF